MSSNSPHQQHPSRIAPKLKSFRENSQQWKENLRRDCIERAKLARRERLRTQRSGGAPFGAGGHCNDLTQLNQISSSIKRDKRWKRDREERDCLFEYKQWVDRQFASNDLSFPEDDAIGEAKALVEQQLQKSIVGLRYCQQVLPLDYVENASKRRMRGGEAADTTVDYFNENLDGLCLDEECKMTEAEYLDLVNAVTEELDRSDEMLEEEIWEMERLEAIEKERLLKDIDDFESWEADQMQSILQLPQPSTIYASPFTCSSSPLVTCPICNSKSLMESTFDGITCTNSTGTNSKCDFKLDVAHDGLSLQHLQSQLARLYEEHSRECYTGVLKFRMKNDTGIAMLMAACEECGVDLLVF